MIDVDFSTDIPIKIDALFQILTDYPKLKELVPAQVKECKILQKTNEETITEELLTFNTYFKKQKITNFKKYGVPTVEKMSNGLFTVKEVIEKPNKPKSNFGILPLYYFRSDIFSSLKKIKPGKGKEFQLTDAIQNLIKEKQKILAITLNKNEEEIDVGTVESYKDSLEITFRKA